MHLYHYALIAPYWSIIYNVLYVIYSAMLHCIKWAVHYILFSVQLNAQCFNCIHCYSYTVLVFPSFYTLCYSYTCISHIVYSLFVHCIIHLVYHTTIVHHISILCPLLSNFCASYTDYTAMYISSVFIYSPYKIAFHHENPFCVINWHKWFLICGLKHSISCTHIVCMALMSVRSACWQWLKPALDYIVLQLMEAIHKQEEINLRLQDYIDRIIVAIMETNPAILEVK